MHPAKLNTALFAGLFLVLVPITMAVTKTPKGEAVQIATPDCDPMEAVTWEVVAYVKDGGYVQLTANC